MISSLTYASDLFGVVMRTETGPKAKKKAEKIGTINTHSFVLTILAIQLKKTGEQDGQDQQDKDRVSAPPWPGTPCPWLLVAFW